MTNGYGSPIRGRNAQAGDIYVTAWGKAYVIRHASGFADSDRRFLDAEALHDDQDGFMGWASGYFYRPATEILN